MKVFTPGQIAQNTGSKYLGVLVAAKYARALNEFRPKDVVEEPASPAEQLEKLTTTALREVTQGSVEFTLVQRRRGEG